MMERALGLSLPAAYRELVSPFPVPALADNRESGLWDDAAALVAQNQALREGRDHIDPWPPHLFAMGVDDAGAAYALDLEDGSVWWFEHAHATGPGVAKEADALEIWAEVYLSELRSDLEDLGAPPDGTPAQLDAARRRGAHLDLGIMALAILLATAVVTAIAVLS